MLVDDILTTGASLVETVEAVRAAGVEPVAAAVMVDRSAAPVEFGFPLHALGRIEIPSWEAACVRSAPMASRSASREAARSASYPLAPPVKFHDARWSDGTT